MFNFFSLKPMLETLETSMFKSKSCSCSVKIQSTYPPSFFTHLYSLSKKHIYVYVYVSDMCIIHTLCVYILKDLKGSSFFAYSFNKKNAKSHDHLVTTIQLTNMAPQLRSSPPVRSDSQRYLAIRKRLPPTRKHPRIFRYQ